MLKVNDSFDDESKEDLDEDDLAFIYHKIYKMWRNKSGSKWRSSSRRMPQDKKEKDKSSIVYYECTKPRHFKSECPDLEKSQDKKFFRTKEKKGLICICGKF